MTAAATDHERELALVVDDRGRLRNVNRGARADRARRLLVEPQLEGRRVHPRLRDVLGVVEPDGEELRRTQHGRLQGRRAECETGRPVDRTGNLVEQPGGQHGAEIGAEPRVGRGHVGDRVAVDHAEMRSGTRDECDKPHGSLLLAIFTASSSGNPRSTSTDAAA